MAWKYPPYPIKDGQVIGIDALNENFLGYTEELSGSLNEHNFSAKLGAPVARTALAADAAHIIHRSAPGQGEGEAIPYVNDYVNRTNWLAVRQRDGWQSFTTDTGGNKRGMGLRMNAKGGACWICGSLNIHTGDIYDRLGPSPDKQLGFGYNIAIQIDGNVVFESILGSGDSTNEFYNGHNGRGAVIDTGGTGAKYNTPQAGGGVIAAQLPVVVDAVVELAPGPHDIRIVVMNIRGQSKSGTSTSAGWGPNAYISTRELFVLEMVR